MTDAPYKLRAKLGDNEFDAEGPEATVREQFDAFLRIVSMVRIAPPTAPAAPAPVAPPAKPPEQSADGAGVGGGDYAAELAKVFSIRDGKLTLARLPQTDDVDADAAVLLLFGFLCLRNEHNVFVTRIAEGLRLSGLQFSKLSRVMDRCGRYTVSAGAGRGMTFGLNNPGVERGRELLKTLAQ